MPTMNLTIATGTDDGFGYAAVTLDNTDTVVFFGDDGDESHAFFRFATDADLAGATIDSAEIVLYYDGGAATITFDVVAADSDNPAAPTTWSALAGLARTTAKVSWVMSDTGTGDQTSPELKTVIQELVDSYAIASGEHIIIIYDPTSATNVREGHTFESTQTGPRLNITYTAGVSDSAVGHFATMAGMG